MAHIDKKNLEHLADLARIELDKKQEEKLVGDLEDILAYFQELNEVNTDGVEPVAGGVFENNVMREDADAEDYGRINKLSAEIIEAFPEKENNFLKVPKMFE